MAGKCCEGKEVGKALLFPLSEPVLILVIYCCYSYFSHRKNDTASNAATDELRLAKTAFICNCLVSGKDERRTW
jgi:hypothetical protein